jgi:hypothetical protein
LLVGTLILTLALTTWLLTLSRTRQLAKADGRDKLLALLQYAAMFAAAGVPGRALKVQRNLGAARKPFRVLKACQIPGFGRFCQSPFFV